MNFETWLRSDLTKPLKVETLPGIFFTADNAANTIGVEVYDDGAAADLSGSCVGYVIRSDGGTMIITGTISGNRASITLPTSAYVMEGPIDIVIKVVNGSVKTTVGACHGYVARSTTDTIIDPGHVIPSIEELLAQIEACEQATAAANAAAANADGKAAGADTAAAGANAAAANANTAKDRANAAASALENMDATASGLAEKTTPTVEVSTIDGHYRIVLGIPKGDKGNTGETGAAAAITGNATAYQNSTSGTAIPTGTWLDTQPVTPQGQFLWIRTILTWNNGQTTTMYSVSRMGIDGRGSVSSVNGISPDANGNVALPVDATPTQDSQNPVASGGVYALKSSVDALNSKMANVINPGGLSNNERYLAGNLGTVNASNIEDFVSSYGLNTGKFKDIYPGCYIQIPDSVANTTWMVGGLDIKHNSGNSDTPMGHGAEFIPRNGGFTHGTQMNPTSTTEGGYKGSAMKTYLDETLTPALQTVLGSHLLKQRVLITNEVDTTKAMPYNYKGIASDNEWADAYAVLMSEIEVYGSMVWGGPYDIGEARTKLPVFNFISPVEFNPRNFWLRAVANSTCFSYCSARGDVYYNDASATWIYARPLIRIG